MAVCSRSAPKLYIVVRNSHGAQASKMIGARQKKLWHQLPPKQWHDVDNNNNACSRPCCTCWQSLSQAMAFNSDVEEGELVDDDGAAPARAIRTVVVDGLPANGAATSGYGSHDAYYYLDSNSSPAVTPRNFAGAASFAAYDNSTGRSGAQQLHLFPQPSPLHSPLPSPLTAESQPAARSHSAAMRADVPPVLAGHNYHRDTPTPPPHRPHDPRDAKKRVSCPPHFILCVCKC